MHIRIAAIDNPSCGGPYDIPVDLVINQYNPEFWRSTAKHIIARAAECTLPTIVLLQHEYGLDPDEKGNDGRGRNVVDMTKTFREQVLTTLVYLYTVLENPDPQNKKILQELAKYSCGLIVTTESSINILESDKYRIEHANLKHIDHDIRMRHLFQCDRLANILFYCG